MPGPRPKPSKLKALAGNPGGRRLNPNEPEPTSRALCPAWLTDQAREEWNRLAKELENLGLLSGLDQTALAAYCENFKRWRCAETHIEEGGLVVKAPSGYPVQNPWVAISNTAQGLMLKFLAEFGMTPSSRSKVNATPKSAPDALELLLSGFDTKPDHLT